MPFKMLKEVWNSDGNSDSMIFETQYPLQEYPVRIILSQKPRENDTFFQAMRIRQWPKLH